jgi:Flp pilus assembly protein TadG
MAMPGASLSKRRQRGVAMIMYSLLILTLILPIMGIAVDLTMLYTVQARLSAAVDGAALGAGRLLGTSTGSSAGSTQLMAGEFLIANFPTSYWGVPALSVTTDASNTTPNSYYVLMTNPGPGAYQIDVKANARVPLIFARIFNVANATVTSTATATRRSTRIIYVVDRSGSLSAAWNSIRDTAIYYAAQASPGVDEMGLVVFGYTAVPAYPNYSKPYPGYVINTATGLPAGVNVPSTGGPDTSFVNLLTDPARTGKTGCTDMLCMLYQTVNGGSTAMSEALDVAYLELQKAHLRDLIADGADSRMNGIVFFSDGVPNQVAVYVNQTGGNPGNWLRLKCSGGQTATCSQCPYNPATKWGVGGDYRYIGGIGPPSTPSDTTLAGAYQLSTMDSASTVNWVKHTGGTSAKTSSMWDSTNCTYMNATGSKTVTISGHNVTFTPFYDLYRIPTTDFYGTPTDPYNSLDPGYKYSNQIPLSKGNYNPTRQTPSLAVSDPYQWGVAAWNVTDNIGYRMRIDYNQPARGDGSDPNDSNHHMRIQINTIGYVPSGGCDEPLLRRLANDPTSTSFVNDGTQQVGKYYRATDVAGVASAMNAIMSSLLRLSE